MSAAVRLVLKFYISSNAATWRFWMRASQLYKLPSSSSSSTFTLTFTFTFRCDAKIIKLSDPGTCILIVWLRVNQKINRDVGCCKQL